VAETSEQEKTDEPSLLRLERAREEGKAPRSRDLVTTSLLLTGAGALLLFGGHAIDGVVRIARASFSVERATLAADDALTRALAAAALDAGLAALPLLALPLLAAVLASVAVGGFLLSARAISFQFSRVDPLAGLGRMFSLRVLVELGKSIVKFAIVGIPTVLLLHALADDLLALARLPVQGAIAAAVRLPALALLGMALATVLVAVLDVAWQVFEFRRNLRMTKQEVKDELKDTEGRPEVKARIRSLAREMARRRMLDDVPAADVIVTNPEHYAVALRYDERRDGAPRVLAKGVDSLALRIRQAGAAAGVPIVQAPALARAVHHSTDVGREIPAGLYVAVARVLAYVHQLERFRRGLALRPELPGDLGIPPDLAR
jgi:flagellar biosynthetic protein FlhB